MCGTSGPDVSPSCQFARPQNCSPDFEQMRVALIAPAWSTAMLRLATKLLGADKGERGTELFVLDLCAAASYVELRDKGSGKAGCCHPSTPHNLGARDHSRFSQSTMLTAAEEM
jgi:hypothetical protein